MAGPPRDQPDGHWVQRARDLAWTRRRDVLGVACGAWALSLAAVVALGVGATAENEATEPTALVLPLPPIAPCALRPDAGDVKAPDRVSVPIGGAPLAEALRASGLAPNEAYRVRRALEAIPGFVGIDDGRFVATLAAGAVAAFELRTPGWTYRAATTSSGDLAAERVASAPSVRLCSGALTLRGTIEESLIGSGFASDLAGPVRDAFAGRVDLASLPPATELRVVAREVDVLGGFGGYDGLAAADLHTPDGASTRVYGVRGELSASYLGADGRGAPGTLPQPTEAVASVWRAHRAALDVALDAAVRHVPSTSPVGADDEGEDADDADDASAEGAEPDAPGDEEPSGADPSRTVARAADVTCSTRIVAGLSKQIIAEGRCLDPDAFARIPARKNLRASSNVFLFLEAPARDRLLEVLDAHPSRTLTINSALRTVAQQVLLSKWGERKRCGVKLAASPSESNHESGLAIDVQEASRWRKALEAKGFRWMGRKDPVHFDYAGPGAVDHRGLDVRAFQRLWNRNHPDDVVGVTGKLDDRTKQRLLGSPASGFPIGARCSG